LLTFFPLPRKAHRRVSWFGSYWMGLFAYLMFWFVVADALFVGALLLGVVPWPAPADLLDRGWLAAAAAAAITAAYGILNALRIRNVRYEIGLDRLQPAGLAGPAADQAAASAEDPAAPPTGSASLHIVVISDLHLGAVHSERRFARVVDKILALQPDLILIPGDLFNDDINRIQHPERVQRLFRRLAEHAPCGVYASLGNHDGGRTFPRMVEFVRGSGVTLLMEETAVADSPLGRIALVGRLDPSPIGGYGDLRRKPTKELFAEVEELAPGLPVIVLDHTPPRLAKYAGKADLVVSGHTHKGQVFPNSVLTRFLYEVDYGHARKEPDGPHIVVTSGAGLWGMPLRVGSSNEIVEIVLRTRAAG